MEIQFYDYSDQSYHDVVNSVQQSIPDPSLIATFGPDFGGLT